MLTLPPHRHPGAVRRRVRAGALAGVLVLVGGPGPAAAQDASLVCVATSSGAYVTVRALPSRLDEYRGDPRNLVPAPAGGCPPRVAAAPSTTPAAPPSTSAPPREPVPPPGPTDSTPAPPARPAPLPTSPPSLPADSGRSPAASPGSPAAPAGAVPAIVDGAVGSVAAPAGAAGSQALAYTGLDARWPLAAGLVLLLASATLRARLARRAS